MPFINVKTDVKIDNQKSDIIKTKLCSAISDLGKSEYWLMINIEDGKKDLFFRGSTEKLCMIQISLFAKAGRAAYDKMTEDVSEIINSELNIEKSRIYIQYIESSTWGYDGSNF